MYVCMCTCVAGSREKSQVLSLSGTVSPLLFGLLGWLVGVFVFVVVVVFVCFVLFEAGFLTDLEFVG